MKFCGTKNNRRSENTAAQNSNAIPQKMSPSKQNGKENSKSSTSHSHSKNGHSIDDLPHGLPTNPYQWSDQEVARWIKHIGYPQYVDGFAQEHIDGEALFALAKDEFGQLGIYSLGHTKNILHKIQALQKSAAKFRPRDPFENDYKSPYTFDQRDHWASHPEAYSQDKHRDKNTYWELWAKIVDRRDFMMPNEYKKLMSRSGLAKHDIEMIWKLSTEQSHNRCGFDEFTVIMKLSHLAQSRIPLYIINVSKLIFYHPPLASTEFFEFSAIFSDLQKQQVLQNMVGFYNLPSQILDSDDRLMELEKKALRPFHPIHFEINAKVLIATFSATISDEAIEELQTAVLSKLKEQMHFKQSVLDKVYVQRPSPKELGMTPAGPPPLDHMGNNMNNVPPPQHQPPHGKYNQHRGGGTGYPPQNRHPVPYQTHQNPNVPPHNGQNGRYNGYDEVNVHAMQQLLMTDDFWAELRSRTDLDKVVDNVEKIRTRSAMQLLAKLRDVPTKSVKFTDEGVKIMSNKTRYELRELVTTNKDALRIKATLLGLSEMDIPHTLKQKHHAAQSHQNHQQNHHHGSSAQELYKGIVIEGLPDVITNDDENIRKLDSAVLNEFIVSHIEVVDNVLRITFQAEVTHKNINQLRKYLKSFLKDDMKLDKKAMKSVSIIPHTRDTWKGETTERSVEQHSNGQYIHVTDSITATPQQGGINSQHGYYNQ